MDPILAYPDFSKSFILTTDASNYALCSVLSQLFDCKDHPIAFASRTLNHAEVNYSTTEKEALAIIWAVEKFKPYLFGHKFTLVTDHKPLIFIKNSSKNSKIIRWRLELENYDYDVTYKEGKANVVADALSRKLEMNNNETNSDNLLQTTHSDTNTRHSAETSEDFFVHFTERPVNSYRNQIFFKLAEQEQIYEESPFARHHRTTICKNSFNSEEIESYLRKFHDGKQSAIYAPESLLQLIQDACRTYSTDVLSHLVIAPNLVEDVVLDDDKYEIVQQAHNRAHRGIQEIEQQLKRSYYFPKMVQHIREYVNSCKICAQHKFERRPI